MAQEYSYSQSASEPAPETLEAKEKKPDFLKDVQNKVRSSYVGAKQKVEQFQDDQREKRMASVQSRLEHLRKNQEVNDLEEEAMSFEERERRFKERKKEASRARIKALFAPLAGLGGGGQPVRYARGRQARGYADQRRRAIFEGNPNALNVLGQGTSSGNAARMLANEGGNASRLLFEGNRGSNASRMLFSNQRSNASRLLMGGRNEARKPSLLSMMTGQKDVQKKKRGITIHIRR